jgi:uncharacterized protein (TIGR00299 family) protein
MKYVYFDTSAGVSGDMVLAALLDLDVPSPVFKKKMAELGLPVDIQIKEVKRAGLRGLKVEVKVKARKRIARKRTDVEALIKKSPFSSSVKKNALAIFNRLFEAEARVHGKKFDEAHLHEAGADDAIIDVVGSLFLAEFLDINDFYCSPLNLGRGFVKSSHGVLPVPPPAVAELLKGIPVYSAWAKEELVTPTGAAIISTLVKKFIPFPEISYKKVGCGAGKLDFPDFPNILRAFYGDISEFKADKKIYTIETNIDDSNPQLLAAFLDRALELGALDVFLTPVVTKKNRLATKLTILAEIDKMERLIRAVFSETSSIGVRFFPVERRVLDRALKKIRLFGEDIAVKVSTLDGKEVNAQPEFSDCLKVAQKSKRPLKEVIELALGEYAKKAKRS